MEAYHLTQPISDHILHEIGADRGTLTSVSFGFHISYRGFARDRSEFGSLIYIMDSQSPAVSSQSLNVLQEYYKDVVVEGKQKWECTVCHRTLSSKQRVEFHIHKIHGKGL